MEVSNGKPWIICQTVPGFVLAVNLPNVYMYIPHAYICMYMIYVATIHLDMPV